MNRVIIDTEDGIFEWVHRGHPGCGGCYYWKKGCHGNDVRNPKFYQSMCLTLDLDSAPVECGNWEKIG